MIDTRFALLLACFLLSGFAALLYETAWTRELAFVFGTSEIAVAVVLAAYMAGLALGAAAAARFAPRLRRPVLAYGLLELAIALLAVGLPYAIAALSRLYVALLGGRPALPEGALPGATLFQLFAAFAVLLPPTALMGATLPLLARHAVRSASEIGSRVGSLYAVNTAGAVAGTLCAAFLLMPALGLRGTIYVGALVNGLVFVAAALLARAAPLSPPAAEPAATRPTGPGWVLGAMALSGAASFAYEILWTRLHSHLLGSSVSAFSSMLAGFLIGIAAGSALASRWARTSEGALRGFVLVQLAIPLAAMAAFVGVDSLPGWLREAGAAGPARGLTEALAGAALLLPATVCIGATYPFAVRALAARPEQAAAASARVLAWNTCGAIVGSLAAGFVLLPGLGLLGTLAAAACVNLALAGFGALRLEPRRLGVLAGVGVAGALLLAVPTPWNLLRTSPLQLGTHRGPITFASVGRSSSILLLDQGTHWRLLTNGLPEAQIDRPGAHPVAEVSNWLGLLPALARPEARDALVIGLGGGGTVDALPSTLERIEVVELEQEVVDANLAVAGERARNPLADPRVRVHVGDARGALLLTEAHYDLVLSQPSHPWTAGASHLYTSEFFELVRSRLRPGGVFAQWIGVGLVDEPLLRTLLATLLGVFENVEVYQPVPMGLVFLASDAPVEGPGRAHVALERAARDFARFGIHRPEDVAAARVLDTAGARRFAGGAPENSDDRNALAMSGARIRRAALTGWKLGRLLARYDPLVHTGDLEAPALVRRLAALGFSERAEAVAESAPGALRESSLGWLALELGRPRGAARHFERALALDPRLEDASLGLLASRRVAWIRDASVDGVAPASLGPRARALVLGWRAEAAEDWRALEALDEELATLRPGDGLFDAATRLRVRWRIESGDPEAAAVALALADTLVTRGQDLGDVLLRASAARAAGRPGAAWSSLGHLAAQPAPNGAARPLARRALELAAGLEETPESRSVRARIATWGR